MADDDLQPVYLIVGSDRPKVRKALARLRQHFAADAIETFTAGQHSGEDVVGAASMLGLLAERKLIIVNSVDSWKTGDVDPILSYVKAPAPDAVVALVASKLASNSRLRKAFDKRRTVECAGPATATQAVSWVRKAFAEAGHTEVAQREATRLVDIVGFDSVDRLGSDIDRIVTWAGDEQISGNDIAQLATPNADTKVYAITDAWASGDANSLIDIAHRLVVDQRESPVRLAGLLGRHIRVVHRAVVALARGESSSEVKQRLVADGVKDYPARKAVDQARTMGGGSGQSATALRRCEVALSAVAHLDANLRGGAALASRHADVVFVRGLRAVMGAG